LQQKLDNQKKVKDCKNILCTFFRLKYLAILIYQTNWEGSN